MTDTKRPEWMPTDVELETDFHLDGSITVRYDNCPYALKRNRRTGLRAQIAKLDELWDQSEKLFNDSPLSRVRLSGWLGPEIAALRKEIRK